jgi:hypothetical protein
VIEVVANRRAEQLQPPHAEPPAELRDLLAPFSDKPLHDVHVNMEAR